MADDTRPTPTHIRRSTPLDHGTFLSFYMSAVPLHVSQLADKRSDLVQLDPVVCLEGRRHYCFLSPQLMLPRFNGNWMRLAVRRCPSSCTTEVEPQGSAR